MTIDRALADISREAIPFGDVVLTVAAENHIHNSHDCYIGLLFNSKQVVAFETFKLGLRVCPETLDGITEFS